MTAIFLFFLSNPGAPGAERVEVTLLASGSFCSAQDVDFVVCRTQKELDKAISEFGIPQKESMTADFGTSVVCLAFAGQHPTAGYGIEAKAAYYLFYAEGGFDYWNMAIAPLLQEDGLAPDNVPMAQLREGDAIVILQAKCPPEGAMLAQVITSPFIVFSLQLKDPKNVYVSIVGCGGGE